MKTLLLFIIFTLFTGIQQAFPRLSGPAATSSEAAASTDDQWLSFPYISSSVNNHVHAVAVSGSDVYAGGEFTQAGTNPANRIARWDGNVWHPLGSGVNGTVLAIAVDGSDVYVAGDFTQAGGQPANRIARWDGEQWHPVGPGFNGTIHALALTADGIYAAGSFFPAGGQPADKIAFWDGEAWNTVGNGIGVIRALAVMNGDLYAGGTFTFAGTEEISRIARLVDDAWTGLEGGVNDEVYALYADGSDLYVGGRFSRANNVNSFKVARWDGAAWHQFAPVMGTSDFVSSFAMYNGDLYIGGDFTNAGGVRVSHFARWSAGAWEPLGTGMNRRILAMAVTDNGIMAGGWFTNGSHYVARFDGSEWQPVTSGQASGLTGLNGYIADMVEHEGSLYVAGRLTGADARMTNHIARWDGQQWHALGLGMNLEVSGLVIHNGELHAGGEFRMANGESMPGVARWDGGEWHRVGVSSPVGGVFSIASWKGDLYIGGSFRNFGGKTYNKIARFDGTEWHDLNGGVDPGQFDFGAVHALLATDDYLYVGGSFTTAGGAPANRLARWDGETWEEIPSEINQTVFALAEWEGHLYVGGQFTTPGAYITRWDGDTWDQPGPGMSNQVFALYPAGDVLYAGGIFFTIGGVQIPNAAKWDGTGWSGLGSGPGGRVSTFASFGGLLYTGGSFTTVGGLPSNFIGAWSEGGPIQPAAMVLVSPPDLSGDVNPRATLTWNSIPGATSYELQIATDAAFTTIINPVTGITGTSVTYTDEPLPELTQLWWRVRAVAGGTAGEWSDTWTFTTSTSTSIAGRSELPRQLTLDQNYPNPFNPATVIRFGLPEQGDVHLEVFSLTGQRVARLAEGNHTGGWHQVVFDASALSSGVYFYRLQTQAGTITRKLTLIK
ncbi:MAG: T9SS type A sorting domain-containing protein [Cyclonatronaceae bacterium]